MSAIQDLQDQITALNTNVTAEIAAVSAKLSAALGDDPAVVAAVQSLASINATLVAETASLTTPATPPAA